jgi:hypothetical protein
MRAGVVYTTVLSNFAHAQRPDSFGYRGALDFVGPWRKPACIGRQSVCLKGGEEE